MNVAYITIVYTNMDAKNDKAKLSCTQEVAVLITL